MDLLWVSEGTGSRENFSAESVLNICPMAFVLHLGGNIRNSLRKFKPSKLGKAVLFT